MPISDIVKRRLGTNPRRRFLIWYQSGHFTAKPPAKKQVFVQYPIGGREGADVCKLRFHTDSSPTQILRISVPGSLL